MGINKVHYGLCELNPDQLYRLKEMEENVFVRVLSESYSV